MDGTLVLFTEFLLVALFLGWLLIAIPRWLAPRHPSLLKSSAYECGEEPIGEPWIHFRVEYYIVALLFVIFDVEAALLYPWAEIAHLLGVAGLVEMAVFVSVLLLGLAYAWRKGALTWK